MTSEHSSTMPPDAGTWPVTIHSAYGDTDVVCDGWIRSPLKTTNHAIKCHAPLYGSTLGEMLAELQVHLVTTKHVDDPMKAVNDQLAATLANRKRTVIP